VIQVEVAEGDVVDIRWRQPHGGKLVDERDGVVHPGIVVEVGLGLARIRKRQTAVPQQTLPAVLDEVTRDKQFTDVGVGILEAVLGNGLVRDGTTVEYVEARRCGKNRRTHQRRQKQKQSHRSLQRLDDGDAVVVRQHGRQPRRLGGELHRSLQRLDAPTPWS
jgi:hypothetical protein